MSMYLCPLISPRAMTLKMKVSMLMNPRATQAVSGRKSSPANIKYPTEGGIHEGDDQIGNAQTENQIVCDGS